MFIGSRKHGSVFGIMHVKYCNNNNIIVFSLYSKLITKTPL